MNICSIRNKIVDASEILTEHKLHVLATSETHLNPTINSDILKIEGYNMNRLDRGTSRGGGVAIYCQDHIPAKTRNYLGCKEEVVLWLQGQLPYIKPMLIGCCSGLQSATY